MRKLARGIIGYEEPLQNGFVTGLSGEYLFLRLNTSLALAPDDFEDLKSLFQKFERNIDKEKKAKLRKILFKVEINNDQRS